MNRTFHILIYFFFFFIVQISFANSIILLEEDFENCSLHAFTTVNATNSFNSTSTWTCANTGNNDYLEISGTHGVAVEDWLISPPIDMNMHEDERLSFSYKNVSEGLDITLLYSVDYNGIGTSEAINAASWTDIPLSLYDISASSYINQFLPHAAIDLSNIEGTRVYFAFRYESTTEVAETWQLDQIRITADYYKTIEDLIDNESNCGSLKTALAQLIRVHQKISYTSSNFDIWDAFYSTDRRMDDEGANIIVRDIYSDNPNGAEPYTFDFGRNQDIGGGASVEGLYYNREHVFPSSWWGGGKTATDTQYVDLHHIFPSDKVVNQMKSNYPLGETNSPTNISLNGSRVGNNSNSAYMGKVFEPIDEYKGDFARTYLYVGTRYQHKMPLWESIKEEGNAAMNGNTYTVFEDWLLHILLTWHENDPVSDRERQRNEAIFSIQHNRNPFIDHPEYVNMIWGSTDGTACYDSALPIQNVDFVLEQVEQDVILSWEIDGLDKQVFYIEHMVDGQHFEIIGQVDLDVHKKNYTYQHLSPTIGKHYYRLLVLGENGIKQISNIKTIEIQSIEISKPKAFIEDGRLVFWKLGADGSRIYIDVLGRQMIK